MLDAYIIDRIRRERERSQREGHQIPLHIPVPPPEQRPEPRREDRDDIDRGTTMIDFHL